MGLLAGAWAFEIKPMMTFIRWRTQLTKGEPIDTSVAPKLVAHHYPELAVVLVLVVIASFMARGAGVMSRVEPDPLPPELEQGRAIYRSQCISCHQADGRGLNGTTAADFIGDPSRLAKTDEELMRSIEKGVPNTNMLAFEERLRPEDRAAVLAYLRHAFGAKGDAAPQDR